MALTVINGSTGAQSPGSTPNALQTAITNGDTIIDSSGHVLTAMQLGVASGGFMWTLDGCPFSVLTGQPLTLPEAQTLVSWGSVLTQKGFNSCLAIAQSLVGNAPPITPMTPQLPPPPVGITQPVPITLATAPSIPGAQPSSSAPQFGGSCLTTAYRFILASGGGYATGTNRIGCSQVNTAYCDPQFFTTLSAAIGYAIGNGEQPYQVMSSQEPWGLIACTTPIDPTRFYNSDGSLGSIGFSFLNSKVLTIAIEAVVMYYLLK
jgi:hypothetical protein